MPLAREEVFLLHWVLPCSFHQTYWKGFAKNIFSTFMCFWGQSQCVEVRSASWKQNLFHSLRRNASSGKKLSRLYRNIQGKQEDSLRNTSLCTELLRLFLLARKLNHTIELCMKLWRRIWRKDNNKYFDWELLKVHFIFTSTQEASEL